jgi:hypothetical protein
MSDTRAPAGPTVLIVENHRATREGYGEHWAIESIQLKERRTLRAPRVARGTTPICWVRVSLRDPQALAARCCMNFRTCTRTLQASRSS